MDTSTQNDPYFFINDIDRTMRENILHLDQKLKGLRAEVIAKIHATSLNQNEQAKQDKKKLSFAVEELDLAIHGIEGVVNLVKNDFE